jgi:hypothetical protein
MKKLIIHTADWQYTDKRRDAFKYAFSKYLENAKKRISRGYGKVWQVVAGDIFQKIGTAASIEDLIAVKDMLSSMSELSDVIIIGGNHDNNPRAYKLEEDNLALILSNWPEMNNKVKYLFGSKVYEADNETRFHHFCICDKYRKPLDSNSFIDMPGIDIALYHGQLASALDFRGFKFKASKRDVEIFDGFDAVMMGDIHKRQVLPLPSGGYAVYAGSPYQHNFSESVNDHGGVFWEIDGGEITPEYFDIEGKYPFIKTDELELDKLFQSLEGKHPSFRILPQRQMTPLEKDELVVYIKSKCTPKNVFVLDNIRNRVTGVSDGAAAEIKQNVEHGDLTSYYQKYAEEYGEKDAFLSLDANVNALLPLDSNANRDFYEVNYFKGQNILSFGDFEFRFDEYEGITIVNSVPGNFGGKTNFFRLFQILLWGEFYVMGNSSKIPSIPNSNLRQDAYIEGIFSYQGEKYFLRRDYLNNNDKISHILHFLNLTDDIEKADTFIELDEEYTSIMPKHAKRAGRDGFYAISLKREDQVATQRLLESMVGDFKSFITNFYYNTYTVQNLIFSKDTERTRDFYIMFGGELLEQKREVAKQILREDKKNATESIGVLYNVETISEKIRANEEKIKTFTQKNAVIQKQVLELRVKISEKEKECEEKRQLLSSFVIEDIAPTLSQINKLKGDARSIEAKIASNGLTKKPSMSLSEVEVIMSEYGSHEAKISEIKSKYAASRAKAEEKHKKIIDVLLSDLEKLRAKRITLLTNYDSLKKDKEKFRDKITKTDSPCDFCHKSLSPYKSEIENKISILENEMSDVLLQGRQAADEISAKERELAVAEMNARKEYENINCLREKEESACNNYFLGLTQIKAQAQAYSSASEQIESLKWNLSSISAQILELEEKKKKIEEKNYLASNASEIKKEYEDKKAESEELARLLKSFEEEQKNNEIEISVSARELSSAKNSLSSLSDWLNRKNLLEYYIKLHDKDGIIREIISSKIPQINAELRSIMASLPYCLEIRDEKHINYYIKRESGEALLHFGSEFEKYSCMIALYLVRLKFASLKIPNAVFFDEVFSQTDIENVPILFAILEEYRHIFKNILLIAHWGEVREMAENRITINKKENSKIVEWTQ